MEREEISFFSAGHRLKGFWYPPLGEAERSPAVVICHGFSGMIELQVVLGREFRLSRRVTGTVEVV